MKNQIMKRCVLGFPIGVFISIMITIVISINVGNSQYIPVPPELVNDFGTELKAFIFQVILSGFFGSVIAAASVVWDNDWSLLKMTLTHFLIITTTSLPIAYLLRWMPRNLKGILSFYIIFILIYIIIWIVLYLIIRNQISKMNRKLSE